MATYDVMRFRASHNSYSGHERGSLIDQLDANVRCLEFDFHDNDFTQFDDYRIGHLKPGAEVQLGAPNPVDHKLGSWLGVVAAWSKANPGHHPVTIVLDAKDDLTDNADADLEELNLRVKAVFGDRLFTRMDFDHLGSWPDVDALRGKVLCVLSGNGGSRAAYRWAFGTEPAMAINEKGNVVLAYRSSTGEINSWVGTAEGGASVSWIRKSTLAASDIELTEPAIQINDAGWVVAVYRFGPRPAPQKHGAMLASKVGHLTDGRINWGKMQIVGDGKVPSLSLDGDNIELIHRNATGAGRQLVTGVIDRGKRQIKWKKARDTQRALVRRDSASSSTHTVRAALDECGAIHCALDGGVPTPARFQQILFVERQTGEDPALFRDVQFFGAGAANRLELIEARRGGLVCRAWGFADINRPAPAEHLENFPATDTPLVAWYQTYVG